MCASIVHEHFVCETKLGVEKKNYKFFKMFAFEKKNISIRFSLFIFETNVSVVEWEREYAILFSMCNRSN